MATRSAKFLSSLLGLAVMGGVLTMRVPPAAAASGPVLPLLLPIHPTVTATPGRVLAIPLRWQPGSTSFTLRVVAAENATNGGLAFAPTAGTITTDHTDLSPFFSPTRLVRTSATTATLMVPIPTHAQPGVYDVGVAAEQATRTLHTTHDHTAISLALQARVVDWITVRIAGTPVVAPLVLATPTIESDTTGAVLMARVTNPSFTAVSVSRPVTLTIRTPHGALVLQDRVRLGTILPHSTVQSAPIAWPHADTGAWVVTESMAGVSSVSQPVTIGAVRGPTARQAITTVVSHAPPRPWPWIVGPAITLLGTLFWFRRRHHHHPRAKNVKRDHVKTTEMGGGPHSVLRQRGTPDSAQRSRQAGPRSTRRRVR